MRPDFIVVLNCNNEFKPRGGMEPETFYYRKEPYEPDPVNAGVGTGRDTNHSYNPKYK
jgi:hypothetical protein